MMQPNMCVPAAATPEVTIGTAVEEGTEFLPLADGAPVPLMFGQQQGFHVWMHLRTKHLCRTRLRIDRLATAKETQRIVLSSAEQLTLVPAVDAAAAQEGWLQIPASLPVFLCPPIAGEQIVTKPIEIYVRVTDELGQMAESRTTVYPFCAEGATKAACETTCAPR